MDNLDVDPIIDDPGGESDADTPPEPKKWAGKYDSPEEAEKGWVEAQTLIGRQASELQQLKDQVATIQYQPAPIQQPVEDEDPNAKFWDDPRGMVTQTIQGVLQLQKQAQFNMRQQIALRREDPLFKNVGPDFEAELLTIPDETMANQQAAAYYAELLYNKVAGQRARVAASRAKDDPSKAGELASEFGIETPTPSDTKTTREDINEKDNRALAALGLDGKDRKAVIDKWSNREDK